MSLYISINFSCLKTIRSVDNNYYFYQNIYSIFRLNSSSIQEINNRIEQIEISKKYFLHPKLNCISKFRKDRINIESKRETNVRTGYIKHKSYGDIFYSPVSKYFNYVQQIVIYSLFSINTAILFEYNNIKYLNKEVFPMPSRIFFKEFITQILNNKHLNISLDIIMSEHPFDELQKIQKNIKNYQPIHTPDNLRFDIEIEYQDTENFSMITLFEKYLQIYIKIYQVLKNNIIFVLTIFLAFKVLNDIQNQKIIETISTNVEKVKMKMEKPKIYYFSDYNIFVLAYKIETILRPKRINKVHIITIINKDNMQLYYEHNVTTNTLNYENKDIITIPSETIIHLPETLDQNQEIKYTLQDIYNYLVQEVLKSNLKNVKKRSKKS